MQREALTDLERDSTGQRQRAEAGAVRAGRGQREQRAEGGETAFVGDQQRRLGWWRLGWR